MRLCIADGSGHTEIAVDVTDPAALAEVQTQFDDLIGRGYAAFVAGVEGGASKRIQVLDTGAEEIVMFPALQGG